MNAYLLGVDIGTTCAKAVLIDDAGAVHASATDEYALSMPQPLWAEQQPEDWWRATVASIRRVLARSRLAADKIAGIGLTGQMHGLVLLDGHGDVLRPAILWNDQRTGDQCAQITRQVGVERLLQLTGNLVLPGFTAPKILWVREHEPDVYARVAKVLLPKDYVRFRLTGAYASDVSDASGTSLFDVAQRRWSNDMLAALDIPRPWLPEVSESIGISARINEAAAAATGLSVGTPVVAGAGDQAAQAVGTGIIDEGAVAVTIGTSGVVFAAMRNYRSDERGRLHAFCHAVPGMWHLMGVMLSAGGSFRWFRDTIGEPERRAAAASGRDAYQFLTDLAATAPAGCDGLIFLPYLSGERTPHADPRARGVFFGLTLRHQRAHLARAVIEGVCFGLRDSLELLRAAGLTVREIRVSGGGARSPLWRGILANVLAAPLRTGHAVEGAAYGAALLAGVGCGVYADVQDACRRTVRGAENVAAPGADAGVYGEIYEQYRSLYPSLAPHFR